MIRLSPTARYALQGMAYLAERQGKEFILLNDAAEAKRLPKNFLGKIFQRLSRRGLLSARRGPGGGYALAKPAEQISLAEIVDTLDAGPWQQRECLIENRGCTGLVQCAIHGAVLQADAIIRDSLRRISLKDLAKENAQAAAPATASDTPAA